MTIVLVFADWCGHCHTFQKDIWDPMCKKNALHNRVAVRDDMLQKTSLANTKFNYLPSVLVVNEKGEAETFTTPDGEATNAMPTPKNQQDMEKIVNVPITEGPSLKTLTPASTTPLMTVNGNNTIARMSPVETPLTLEPLTNSSATMEANVNALGTPQGQTYKPMVMEQKGGAFYETMRQVSQGIFPIAILGGLSYALKGGASKRRKTHKKRRMLRA